MATDVTATDYSAGVLAQRHMAEAHVSLTRSVAYLQRILISVLSIGACTACSVVFDPIEFFPLSGHAATWGTGIALLLAGVAVRLWAASCLGGRKSSEVVCGGPYSLCRNPLYVGTLLIAVSQSFFYESFWILAGLAIPVALYAFGVVPAEERKLRVRLGDCYREYCRRVPRWWPRWSGYAPNDAVDVTRTRCFQHELRRSIAWLALPLAPLAIAMIRASL
ncbi:MAG: isoprenylcysteine carboxylmethyltransferase family protein [Planctomycetaceae bacterium]|nr:isoprenylcysteine carboxylmethyltransferase family protein [Planctomycetaceae bacterium]